MHSIFIHRFKLAMVSRAALLLIFPLTLTTCSKVLQPSVLTYNIRLDTPADGPNQWPFRKERVAELLRNSNASVIGLQEALHHQITDLQVIMPNFNWVGVGRDDGKTAGEFSPIFYEGSLVSVVRSGTFWLSETPDVPGSKSWDAAITRVCTWAEFAIRDMHGYHFLVLNTHFDHMGQEARLRSMELLSRKVKEIADGKPYLLMGDFNCEPDSPPYALTQDTARWYLTDAWAADPANANAKPCTFTGFQVRGAECRRIDYIFLSPHIKLDSCRIIGTNDGKHYPSDHLPVVAKLRF